jgi:hypothetical protein
LVFDRHDGLKEDAIIADCVSKSKVVSLDGLFRQVAKYFGTCFKNEYKLNCQEKNKFVNLSQNKGLSP